MSSSIHTALHHRVSIPSWFVGALLALVVAIGAIAIAAGSQDSSPVAPAPAATPARLPALGTDVAAPDQQAPLPTPAGKTS